MGDALDSITHATDGLMAAQMSNFQLATSAPPPVAMGYGTTGNAQAPVAMDYGPTGNAQAPGAMEYGTTDNAPEPVAAGYGGGMPVEDTAAVEESSGGMCDSCCNCIFGMCSGE
jgi:hypothetical protein